MTDFIQADVSPKWLTQKSPDRDVVVSSRVRFARNIEEFPFPPKATATEKDSIRSSVQNVLKEEVIDSSWYQFFIDQLNERQKTCLVERRLASEELTREPYGGLFVGGDESISVMVNEEDHLRIQSFAAGNQIDETFDQARGLERDLDNKLPFAFNEKLGFLTSCPTNVGTGMRASVLVHMPGLVMTQKIDKILKAVSNLGLTVRGFAGEGSESRGFYFQVSNQVTLGQSAEEMKGNLQRVTKQIVDQERSARKTLLNTSKIEVENQIWRSYGITKYAQKLDSSEALERLSYIRLGIDYGFFDDPEFVDIDGLMLLCEPSHLMMSVQDDLESEERDFYRAKKVRQSISESDPTELNSESSEGDRQTRETD